MRWWHAFYATVLVGVVLLTLVQDEITVFTRTSTIGLLAALALWYVLVGRLASHSGKAWQSGVYLGGALVLFIPSYVLAPWSGFLLMALCPQAFMLLSHRRAVLACLLFNLVPAVLILNSESWHVQAIVVVAVIGLVIMAYASLFGAWIDRIIAQSQERAELIEQLEVTRSELARANHEAGVLAERERLAAEIHDTLAQGFTSVLMLLQAVESEMERDPTKSRRHLELAQRTAGENLAEARTLVAALAPARLEDTSLAEALRRLVDDVGAALGIPADFDIIGDPRPLPAGAEVVLLRATQEALANVRKHAGASGLSVRLSYDGETRLEVADDGRGFDPVEVDGFGLRGMRARVAQVGGTLEIASEPQAGTTAAVTLP